jgi:hypothetical protein
MDRPAGVAAILILAGAMGAGLAAGCSPGSGPSSEAGAAPAPSPAAARPAASGVATPGGSAVRAAARGGPGYAWLASYDAAESIAARFPPPPGFVATAEEPGSFGAWLGGLPLKKGRPPIHFYNGDEKPDGNTYAAVVDIDVGTRDLQQCADSIIRLRAEYQFACGRAADIHFNFTSQDRVDFARWADGFTPVVRGSTVTWNRGQPRGADHAALRSYLDVIFQYAGTLSLEKEMRKVASAKEMRAGDIFITPGSPGHAVIIARTAADPADGRKVFLLVQGFMPAQEMHVLRNPAAGAATTGAATSTGTAPTSAVPTDATGVWFDAAFGATLRTPQWSFKASDLRRF